MKRLQEWLSEYRGKIGFSMLVTLIIVGLMNVIHVITFLRPADGAVWEMQDDAPVVVETDQSAETSLQVGDRLLAIDDVDIGGLGTLEDVLYDVPIGSKHLYVLERNGARYEPWVTIRGVKDVARHYYLFAIAGFVYLIFLLIIVNQDIGGPARRWLIVFALCVFLAFVFHFTERFTPLDWISYALDYLGRVLLPSSLLAIALTHTLDRRINWILQPLHWVPSCLLVLVVFLWFPQMGIGGSSWGEEFYQSVQDVQRIWSGTLMAVALALILLPKNQVPSRLRPFWLVSWLPYTLEIWNVHFPGSSVLAGLMPILVPLALLVYWSQSDVLYLGRIGKKTIVYVSVVLLLFLGFFLFIGIFQALLGSSVSREGQIMISAFGIMFAVVSYDPLKAIAEGLLGRLLYGKRFEAVRHLTDFSEFNRADTDIRAFAKALATRLEAAFGFDQVQAYVRQSELRFVRVGDEDCLIEFRHLPGELMMGNLARGHDVATAVRRVLPGDLAINVKRFLAIRVHGEVLVLISLPAGPQDPRLSPDDLRLLSNLANQCEVLLENMELYRSLAEKVQSINKLKEFNENIIESSRIGILATDEIGGVVSCNKSLLELLGAARNTVMGKTFEALFRCEAIENHHLVRATEFIEGQFRNQKGELLVLEVQKTPLKSKENEIYGTLYLVEDIRARRKFQEQLTQQEKLASIGMLAAGVAHEINTPLTGIAGYSQLLMTDSTLSTGHLEMIRLIEEQSRRAANIVKELLNFSRRESAPMGPVDLVQVLRQTIHFLSHQAAKNSVNVRFEEEDEFLVDGYANQIQQVFINIIVNAMDAMPSGGDLTVRCERHPDFVELTFRDSGVGIPADVRSRIFDPFFTTKEAGKGTGLGLSVVYNIMQDHDATIEVESELDKGTAVKLMFPRSSLVETE